MKTYKVAFAGNPNVGKSAWINALSKAHFQVGNWPGVTVQKKEAIVTWGQYQYHLIDLPGCYSLEDSGNEESITASFLRTERVDLIVNVVDATNLSRNLLLTLYLRELQIPMIIIFNFMDEVEKNEIHIDVNKLQRRLQIPIYPYSAFDKKHYKTVEKAIQTGVEQDVFYYPLLEKEALSKYIKLFEMMEHYAGMYTTYSENELHALCAKLFQQDKLALRQVEAWGVTSEQIKPFLLEDMEVQRFAMVSSLMKYVEQDEQRRYARSKKIDQVFLHPIWGLPLFFLLFTVLLLFIFQVSTPWNECIDFLINTIGYRYASALFQPLPSVLQHLLLDGVLSGVGGVLVFIPLMSFLYIMLSLLEESGYMARIAFLLDRMMRQFHLSGKSFVSLLLGFGCNVPAIYATRTLDSEKEKKLTALLIPFMSCGARLPVYVLFAAAFFPHKAGLMIVSVYGIGILVAFLMAFVYSKFANLKDERIFVLELPPYRTPKLRVVFHKVGQEVKGYVRKACGIVMLAMVVLWGLSYFPSGNLETSYLATISKQVAPIFEPLGFGDRWQSVAALPGGIIAKETIVGFFEAIEEKTEQEEIKQIDVREDLAEIKSQFLQATSNSVRSLVHPQLALKANSDTQVQHIRQLWSGPLAPLKAFSFMVYVLLSIPCIMTLQALYHEYGKKIFLLSCTSMIVIPYVVSLFIYQFFSLLIA